MLILGEQFLHVLVDSKRRQTDTTSNFTFKILNILAYQTMLKHLVKFV